MWKRGSGGERDEAGEIGAQDGLRRRVVADVGDRPAFELGGRRKVRSGSDDCKKTRRDKSSAAAQWAYLSAVEHV